MSKPRYGWWSYAKAMARGYPALLEKAEELRRHSMVADYSGQIKAPGASRTTETAALRQLPPSLQAELDAVALALDGLRRHRGSARLRLRIVEMVYFRQTHTLYGAAAAVHVSEATAKRYNGDFLRSIARARGLLD